MRDSAMERLDFVLNFINIDTDGTLEILEASPPTPPILLTWVLGELDQALKSASPVAPSLSATARK